MNTPNNAAALLPCPFCGSNSIDPKGWASANSAGPACDDCGASAGNVSNNLADNIAAWNTRATLAQPDATRPRAIWPDALSSPERRQLRTLLECVDRRVLSLHEADQLVNLIADALTSQPSGEAPEWVELKRNEFGYFYQTSAPAVMMPTGRYFFHPNHPAPAPGVAVASALRTAALALADLAERNTDDGDEWAAAIAAVRSAALAPKPEGDGNA